MELHCSQTCRFKVLELLQFETPMELHCSQTLRRSRMFLSVFETPMELHCSQTEREEKRPSKCLRPLWNYTALKPPQLFDCCIVSLRPLWNYTALKLYIHS